MKKISIIFFLSVLVVGLAACGKEEKSTEKKETKTVRKESKKATILVPKKEIQQAMKETNDEIVLFYQTQNEAETLFTQAMNKEIDVPTFQTQYEEKTGKMTTIVAQIEGTLKAGDYNEVDKQFVAYYQNITSILKEKEKAIANDGEVNGEIINKATEKIKKETIKYNALFTKKSLEVEK